MSKKPTPKRGKGHVHPTVEAQRRAVERVVAPELSPAQQAAAVQRVAKSFRELAKPPEGFIEMLERLEIPYVVEDLMDNETGPVLIVAMRDLIEGEGRNQSKGSVLQQIYGDKQAELTGMFQQIQAKVEGGEDVSSNG